MKKRYTNIILIFLISLIGIPLIQAQTTEDFEGDTAGATTFTDDGQNFTITNGVGESDYDIEFVIDAGWNGTNTDHKFVDDSDSTAAQNDGTSFSIRTTDGTDITIKSLYLFVSRRNVTFPHSGTVTITGKRNGSDVYTITKSSGFVSSLATNNGYTFFNFSTEGSIDNSDKSIDELLFSSTGDADYMALDGLKWELATITDNTNPVITVCASTLANINADASCQGTMPDLTGSVTATDNSGVIPVISQSPAAGATLGLGTTAITLTATDGAGNTATCQVNQTVVDTTDPVIIVCASAPSDISANALCQGTTPDLTGAITATDNCTGAVVVTQIPAAGATLGLGITTITLTATDGAGNYTTCTVNQKIVDNMNPIISCPGNQTEIPNAFGQVSLPDYTALATATDNCDASPTVTQSPAPGTVITETTTITLTATDWESNAAQCTFDVVIYNAPLITLGLSGSPLAENAGVATITATLSAVSSKNVTVTLAPSGTAIGSGVDYTLSSTTIIINAGSLSGTATITGEDDVLVETAETVIIDITGVTNGIESGTQQVTASITDDDAAPTVAFTSTSSSGLESVNSKNLAVNLSAAATKTITVNYAVTGTATGADYTLANGTLSFAVGDLSKNITISSIIDDVINEGNETVIVTLLSPVNAVLGTDTVHTYTITGNDAPNVGVFDWETATDNGTTVIQTVNGITATVTNNNVDIYDARGFGGSTGNIINGYGTTTVSFNNPINISALRAFDYDMGSTRTWTFTPTGGSNSPVVISVDDYNGTDVPLNWNGVTSFTITTGGWGISLDNIVFASDPLVAFSNTTSDGLESVSSADIAVSLSSISDHVITVDYTISGTATGEDYSLANGTLSFAAGELSKNITISSIVDDAINEGNETVIVTLSSPINAVLGSNSVHTYTITGNDAPNLGIFDWETARNNGSSVTQTVNGITAIFSGDSNTYLGNTLGGGSTGYSVTGYDSSVTVSFSNPVNISGLRAFFDFFFGMTSTWTFTPTGGNNSPVVISVDEDNGTDVTLNWNGVTSFTITTDGFGVSLDNIEFASEPLVAFSTTSSEGPESISSANIAVSLSSVSSSAITVDYTISGTATGADYTLSDGTLSFAAGDLSKNITISSIVDDAINEWNETVIVTLSSSTNAILGTNTVHTYTITDNDARNVGVFDWETATDIGSSITQTVNGITATVTSDTIDMFDAGGYGGSTGNFVDTYNLSLTVSFSNLVSISTLRGFKFAGRYSNEWTFTPTGGSNSPVVVAVDRYSGTDVTLNWRGVTSFTITRAIGRGISLDNIAFSSAVVPTVTTTTASSIASTSATIGGNVTNDGGDTVTERGIVWNTSGTPTISSNKALNGSGTGVFSKMVSGLPVSATIYYRAFATNSFGTNYGTVQTFTTLRVVPTITFNNISKTYGDANFDLGATSNSGGTIIYSVVTGGTGTVTLSGTNNKTVTIGEAGTVIIRATQAVDGIYDSATKDITLTINKAILTATADDKLKEYGDVNPVFTYAYAGFKNSETSAVLTVEPTASSIAATTTNVGSVDIDVTGGLDANYDFSYVKGTLTIGKATLTVTADDKLKEYGDVNPVFTYAYAGFKNSETSAVLTVEPTASSIATSTTNVGSVDIDVAGGLDANYDFSYVKGTLTIGKATLTATADDKLKEYGDANPVFTYSYGGFKNSETSAVLTVEPIASSIATSTTNVGTVDIDVAGGLDANYDFSYVKGTLNIGKVTLIATADDKLKEYGDENPVFTYSYAGFKNSETAAVLTVEPTASSIATTTSNVGSVDIDVAGGLDANYDFSYVKGVLTIGKATLTATADDKTREYGDANPEFTYVYAGFKNSETSEVLTVEPSASSIATTTSNVGTVDIEVNGGLDDNYDFLYAKGTLTIGKATLTATADDKTKEYGDENPAFTIAYSGFKGADTANDLGTAPSISSTATTTTIAGTELINLTGGSDNNYSITLINGVLTIIEIAPSIETANPTNVTGVTAVLGGEITSSGGGNILDRGIVYSSSSATPTTADMKVEIGNGSGTFSEEVSGLNSETTYYYQSYVTNATETSYGGVMTFTTLDITAPNAPVIVSISDYTCSETDEITADNTLTIFGRAEASALLEIFINSISIGTTIADASGNWTFDNSGITLPNDYYEFTATATDAASNTSDIATEFEIEINTIDTDNDGAHDFCDDDDDNDGIDDYEDNSPLIPNSEQSDIDGNGIADVDEDCDNDGIVNYYDTDNSGCQEAIAQKKKYGFSPNGDGINDTWFIEGIELYPNNVVRVYNRSGKLVFEKKGYKNTWNGHSNKVGGNDKLPVGGYLFIIELNSQDVKSVKGWLYINY